jgi:hypothetical protein
MSLEGDCIMAKRKSNAVILRRSIAPTASGMSADPSLPPDGIERTLRLAKLADMWIKQEQTDLADQQTDAMRKFEGKGIAAADIKLVRGRIADAVLTLGAIHGVAWRAAGGSDPKASEQALTLIFEAARSAARALDACQVKLGGVAMGCFTDDDLASE